VRKSRAGRILVSLVSLGFVAGAPLATPAVADDSTPSVTLTAATDGTNPKLPGDLQGFSVESADFAHGYLTS
jgi:hypothetical protein